MRQIYHFLFCIIICCTGGTMYGQTNFYVHPVNGNDSNPGTEAAPFKTIQKAAEMATPGSIVFLRGGTYTPAPITSRGGVLAPINTANERNWATYTPILKYTKSGGNANQPITFRNYPGEVPILRPHKGFQKADGTISKHCDSSGTWSLIKIHTDPQTPNVVPAYLVFEGLVFHGRAREINLLKESLALEEQKGSQGFPCDTVNGIASGCEPVRYNGQGIVVTGPFAWDPDILPLVTKNANAIPHHITVRNCVFKEFPGAGISFQRADYITVENCEVANNCWYTIFGSSGINLYQCVTTGTETTLSNDYRVKIVNNVCYGNGLKVKNQNLPVRYDGNGIIIDDFIHAQDYVSTDVIKKENNPNRGDISYKPYLGRTLVANNILFANGGSGIKIYSSQYTDVFHNTLYNNGIGDYRYDNNLLSLQHSLFIQAIVNEKDKPLTEDFRQICNGALQKQTLLAGHIRVYNNLTYNTVGYPNDGVAAECLSYHVATHPDDKNLSNRNYIHTSSVPMFTHVPSLPISLDEKENLIDEDGNTVQSYVQITYQPSYFKLATHSPAINYGIPVWDKQDDTRTALAYDLGRYTRDALPDAGVYEVPTPCTPYIEAGSMYTPHAPSTIEPQQRTVFRTQRYILLRNTFEAKPGGVFVMEVDKCNMTPNAMRVATTEPDILQTMSTTQQPFSAYPNPVLSGQELYFGVPVSQYRLFNGAGVEVRSGTVKGSVSVAGLAKGLYILHTDVGVQKIVIE